MTPGYDVFLCYKWEDKDSAQELLEALEERGLRGFRDEIGLDDWDPLTEKIREALRSSRTLVALVTPRFPISPHCRQELHEALTAAYHLDAGSTRRVLAVTQGVSAELLRPRQLCRFRLPRDGKPSADLADELARTIGSIDDRTFGDAPASRQPQWWPSEGAGDSSFRGRGAELWELHEGLRARDKDRDRGQPIVSVRASGGQGKSVLCLQYARWFAQDHPGGVFVINLGGSDPRFTENGNTTQSAYLNKLAELAEHLGLDPPPGALGPLVAIREMLDSVKSPYLWIVDDVPSSDRELVRWMAAPTPLGKTLVTTRGRFAGEVSDEIDLADLEPVAAAAILTSRHAPAPGERVAVQDIVEVLGAHPLGLSLAAGLTTYESFDSYEGLLGTLSATEPDALELAAQLGDRLPGGITPAFSRTLLRAFELLDEHTQQVMAAASLLAPVPVPVSLVRHMVTPNHIHVALATADDHGLVSLVDDESFVMHALTARALRIHLGATIDRESLRDRAMLRLTAIVEGGDDPTAREEILQHLPHVRAVVGVMPGGDSKTMTSDDHHLVNETGKVQVAYGDVAASAASFEALYDACARSREVDAITRYAALVGLANAVGLNGEWTRALSLKHRAADDMARELGPDDPGTWTAWNNLAVSHWDIGRYDAAHDLFRRVHEWRRRHLGPSHRETLVALGNLAIVHAKLDGTPRAVHLHQLAAHRLMSTARSRWRHVAQPNDPEVLALLNNLALSHRRLGEQPEALNLLSSVYLARTERIGAAHPDTLDTLENLIILQHELGQPRGSFQELLLRRLNAQGRPHPATMTTMRNLLVTEAANLPPTSNEGLPSATKEAVEVEPSGELRLEGDHVDLKAEVLVRAISFQVSCVTSYGSDDPRTMAAVAYLAYCLAAADQLDGQLEHAAILIDDAYDGLADALDAAAEDSASHPVTTAFLERETAIAERIQQWISRAIEDAG
ncbi:toll/interleukin-1 receptor domain-containing protein [Kribbella lupini]|uniref:TIR domain-containing protein n=1 Tax=Kribbella lupini TaxID=291602 RepID=A0ABN2CL43_9ACTN